MRRLPQSLCTLALAVVACGSPQTGDAGSTPLDVVAGYSGSPTMNPGIDCLLCHTAGPNPPFLASYRPWTIAGTVYSSPDALADAGQPNVQILVTDANGQELTLLSNEAGNFYTAESVAFPLKSLMLQNKTHRMQMDLSSSFIPDTISSCNNCHTTGPEGFSGVPGRLFVEP